MHICLSGICWVWKRFPDWVEKWSLQLSCNFNLENEWMDPVQSFGWDPVFKIQQNNEYVASQPAGIRLGQGECQNISDFFTFVKAEANTRNADSLQMWVVHQRVCVCVFFSILPTGCQHFLAFWLHLQQRQSEISFTLNMKTTIDLSSMHQPVIYYTRAMYSARIKGPSAFPWCAFVLVLSGLEDFREDQVLRAEPESEKLNHRSLPPVEVMFSRGTHTSQMVYL